MVISAVAAAVLGYNEITKEPAEQQILQANIEPDNLFYQSFTDLKKFLKK